MRHRPLLGAVGVLATLLLVTPASAEVPDARARPAVLRVVELDEQASPSERMAALRARQMELRDGSISDDFVLVEAAESASLAPGGAVESIAPWSSTGRSACPTTPGTPSSGTCRPSTPRRRGTSPPATGTVVAVLDSGAAFEDFGAFRRAPDLAADQLHRRVGLHRR